MLDRLDALVKTAKEALGDSRDLTQLDEWRVKYLGKKSELTEIFKEVGKFPEDERPLAGKRANEVKTALEKAYGQRAEELKTRQRDAFLQRRIDVTLPGRPIGVGALAEVEMGGEAMLFFLLHCGGGIDLTLEGREVTVITPESPVGTALLDKKQAESFSFRAGSTGKILSVA